MALTYTPGGVSDNSYCSIDLATTYFADSMREQEWLSFSQSDRERALIEATKQIENLGGSLSSPDSPKRNLFNGVPYVSTQSLHFPRTIDIDKNGAKVIPISVREAVIEQAFYLLNKKKNPNIIDADGLRKENINSISIDGVSAGFTVGRRPNGICKECWDKIKPFIKRITKTVV